MTTEKHYFAGENGNDKFAFGPKDQSGRAGLATRKKQPEGSVKKLNPDDRQDVERVRK
jgi:hypothetical protein